MSIRQREVSEEVEEGYKDLQREEIQDCGTMNLKKVLKHHVDAEARTLASQAKAKGKAMVSGSQVAVAPEGLSMPPPVATICMPIGHGKVPLIETQSSLRLRSPQRAGLVKCKVQLESKRLEGTKAMMHLQGLKSNWGSRALMSLKHLSDGEFVLLAIYDSK